MASRRIQGTVLVRGERFLAHVQCRIGGKKKNIYGPTRTHRKDAEQDLFELQTAGAGSVLPNVEAMKSAAKELKGKEHSERGAVEKKGRSRLIRIRI